MPYDLLMQEAERRFLAKSQKNFTVQFFTFDVGKNLVMKRFCFFRVTIFRAPMFVAEVL
jgi:hypothetical protein